MADRKLSEEFREEIITYRLFRDECVYSKAWQVERTERMSSTEEAGMLETPDRKTEGKQACRSLKQYIGTCLGEMKITTYTSICAVFIDWCSMLH